MMECFQQQPDIAFGQQLGLWQRIHNLLNFRILLNLKFVNVVTIGIVDDLVPVPQNDLNGPIGLLQHFPQMMTNQVAHNRHQHHPLHNNQLLHLLPQLLPKTFVQFRYGVPLLPHHIHLYLPNYLFLTHRFTFHRLLHAQQFTTMVAQIHQNPIPLLQCQFHHLLLHVQ